MRFFMELWLLNVYMLRLSCLVGAFKGLECFQTETYQIFYFSTETIFLMYIYIHIDLSIKSSRTSIFATFMNKYWRHIFCSFTSEKSECSSMNSTTCFLISLFGKSYDAGAFPWSYWSTQLSSTCG